MHETFMQEALRLAALAGAQGEVPVGAVIVHQQQIIGRGYNLRERDQCVLRHAELLAIEEACRALASWRLNSCQLYVTLEPCLMCAGALYQARIGELIFGAYDAKAGALGSLYEIHRDERLNHRFPVVGGVLGEDSARLLQDFFRRRRAARTLTPT